MNIGADLEKEKPDTSNLPQVGEDETTELQQLMEEHALPGQETKKQLADLKKIPNQNAILQSDQSKNNPKVNLVT